MTKPATRLLSVLALGSASLTLLACAGLSRDREVAELPPEPLYVAEAPAPVATPPVQAALPPRAAPAKAGPPRAQPAPLAVVAISEPVAVAPAVPVSNDPGQVQVNISGVLRMFVDGKLMSMEGSEGWVRGGLKPGAHLVEVRNVAGKTVASKSVTVEPGKCTHVRYDDKSLGATGTGPLVDTGV